MFLLLNCVVFSLVDTWLEFCIYQVMLGLSGLKARPGFDGWASGLVVQFMCLSWFWQVW